MTLEDFFTLTEMKDGLTTSSRVQELVSVMQKEKDCVFKNAGDATRQWAAVASTIAATENKDCLDLFIQLDGLYFINRWLKDAQNFGIDSNDSFVEEAITTMLRAVEKLCLDSEKSILSGIHLTVSNLLGHDSTKIRDGVRMLLDSWKGGGNGDTESLDVEVADVNDTSHKIFREEGQPSVANGAGNDNDHASALAVSEKPLVGCSDNLPQQTERIASVPPITSSDNTLWYSVSEEYEDVKERSPIHPVNVTSSSQEVAPTNEGLPSCTTGETTSVGTCNIHVPNPDSFDGQPDAVKFIDLGKIEKPEQNVNSTPEKIRAPEICSPSSKVGTEPVSMGAGEAKSPESVRESALEHYVENSEDGGCDKIIAADIMRMPASDRSGASHDDCYSNALQDASVSDSKLGKAEVLEISVSGTENFGDVKKGKVDIYNDGEDASSDPDSSKPGKDFRIPNIIAKKSSDDDFDYGIVDALELARQVAQEVEREVCSSSSEKVSEGKTRQPDSPDSERKEDELTCVGSKEASSRQSRSAASCSENEHAGESDKNEAEPECRPDVELLQVTEAAQDSGGNSAKHLCAFDLNEVDSDDMDVSVNTTSTPIPVVSASRPAPTIGLPGAPLQFEGTLGWKGSAATSAFRPASPRKNCDSERNLSVDRNSDTSKQRQDWLDFDLNVVDGEEGMVNPNAESSGILSGQSSVVLSPKRSSRIELDLNSIGDDGDAQPSGQRMEGQLFLGRNGYWSPSPASSSSSMQPSARNIDLNDRPCFQTDLVDQGRCKSSHSIDAFEHSKSSDAPVISILGARVEVGRKDCVPQNWSLPNGKAIETAIDLTMSRPGGVLGIDPTLSYNHSTVFGYNGSTSAPPLSFSSAPPMYGAIPYMVNSRGVPVVPQVGGSSSTVLSSYSQPPIIMSMTGTQLGLNGFEQSRPNFDLNSGFMVEGGNREALATRQFFFPGQGRTMEEQVRTIPQPSSSVVGGKRKEPDSGWDSYSFSYKHPQPPWK